MCTTTVCLVKGYHNATSVRGVLDFKGVDVMELVKPTIISDLLKQGAKYEVLIVTDASSDARAARAAHWLLS